MSSSLLTLADVSHRYGGRPVVREVAFEVAAGAIVSLLGPSGCGKTTLLRLIAGFDRPEAGAVRLDGEVVSSPHHLVAPEHRRMGMVFQDFALFPHLTVGGNIGFGLPREGRVGRIEELLALTGLDGLGARYPHELSGGQQQRVALARALAPRPRLVLLDEPFSGLDVSLRERLAGEVRGILVREGTTAILVTHDQHEAFAFADTIGVMNDGRLEQWAPPHELYHRPATRFVAGFIGEGAFVPGVRTAGDAETELGRFPVDVRGSGQHGDVDVLIRPDRVREEDASPCRATVVARAFRGAEALYTLQLSSGARLFALLPSLRELAHGATIGIRVDADRLVAFARATPTPDVGAARPLPRT